MDSAVVPPRRTWTVARTNWIAAVERLRSGTFAGPLEVAVLTPLVAHFERAWDELRALAVVAESFQAPVNTRPLPAQHIAEFILDDLIDVFREAVLEVVLLIPAEERWAGDPDPDNILAEAERFDRYLVLVRLAAAASPEAGPLSGAIARAATSLEDWAAELAPIIAPIREVLDSVNFPHPQVERARMRNLN